MKLKRLKWILIISFVTISTVPLLCVGIAIYFKGQKLLRENVTSHFINIIDSNSNVVNRFIKERESDLRLMAELAREDNFNNKKTIKSSRTLRKLMAFIII